MSPTTEAIPPEAHEPSPSDIRIPLTPSATNGNKSGTAIAADSIERFEAWAAIAPHKVTAPAKERHPAIRDTTKSHGMTTCVLVNPRYRMLRMIDVITL